MSSIFLCSEDVRFKEQNNGAKDHSVLEYTGNLYVTYSLDASSLRRRASGERRIDAQFEELFSREIAPNYERFEGDVDKISEMQSFRSRFRARDEAKEELTRPFVVPFQFHIDIPQEHELSGSHMKKHLETHIAVPGERKEWSQYTEETKGNWDDSKPVPDCSIKTKDGRTLKPEKGCINTWIDASNGPNPQGSTISFTMMHKASLDDRIINEIKEELDCDFSFKPLESDEERGLSLLELNAITSSPYDDAPKKGKRAKWTKHRCDFCCDDLGASSAKKLYRTEPVDRKARSCKSGKVLGLLGFGGKASDQTCKKNCCGLGRKPCEKKKVSDVSTETLDAANGKSDGSEEESSRKEESGISTEKSDAAEGKSDASKEESRGFIGRVAKTARRASEAILGKKTQQKLTGSSNKAEQMKRRDDDYDEDVILARMNSLTGAEQNIIDSMVQKYMIPDQISEWITIDASLPGTRTPSRVPNLALPPSENIFQVSTDAFGTPSPGSVRDSCSRSWLFYGGPQRRKP